MNSNNIIRSIIEKYNPASEKEEKDKIAFLQLINNFDDILTRNNTIGHITASGFVINEAKDKALMLKHNIMKAYLFPGGHADGETDLLGVAIREVEEETGIKVAPYQDDPIAINVGPVPRHIKKGQIVPPHLHFDIIYLLMAQNRDMSQIHTLETENSDVAWFNLEETYGIKVSEYVDETTKEIVSRIRKLK